MAALKVALITADRDHLPDWVLKQLADNGIELAAKKCTCTDDVLACAHDAQVVWTFGRNEYLTADVLDKLPACKAIMRSGSGLDDMPVEAAKTLGIDVLNTPEAIAESVAEHTVALLLALTRRIPQYDREVASGTWESAPNKVKWHVAGQTLGLIGFGLIARHVRTMLGGFDMTVMAYDPYADTDVLTKYDVKPAPLENVLRESDFVSVHCPLTDQTQDVLGETQLRMMKPTALLINTSRGGVIDEPALVRALREGWIAGAALDVLKTEPPAGDNPLLAMNNVIVTPHIAAFSDQFERKFWQASIDKLVGRK